MIMTTYLGIIVLMVLKVWLDIIYLSLIFNQNAFIISN